MPVVFRHRWFRFFFYSNEGLLREPAHVYVDKNDCKAKFWIKPVVSVAYNDSFDTRTLRQLLDAIVVNRDRIEGMA